MTRDPALLLAEQVTEALRLEGIDTVVIGAMALAVHHYPRATTDVDLAIAVAPDRLEAIAAALSRHPWRVTVRLPDAQDPLGGVIDVRSPKADLVRVVNFDNAPAGGFPRLVTEALAGSSGVGGTSLRVANLPCLVAFKLYAGGAKSLLDVLELLRRNEVDLGELRCFCASLRLDRALDRVLALRDQNY